MPVQFVPSVFVVVRAPVGPVTITICRGTPPSRLRLTLTACRLTRGVITSLPRLTKCEKMLLIVRRRRHLRLVRSKHFKRNSSVELCIALIAKIVTLVR